MWQTVTIPPPLNEDETHLWRFVLDDFSDETHLSTDERERANRLKIPVIRQRFIAARTGLRSILARYAKTLPENLVFEYGDSGKPSLPFGFQFNLTHSENLAVVAVARTAVGVDIERLRPVDGLDYIATSAFTEDERRNIQASENKVLAFFRCWTRKEAYMKARGEGFKIAATFSVSVDEKPRLLDKQNWSMIEFSLISGWVGALCMQGQLKNVCYLQTENKFPT